MTRPRRDVLACAITAFILAACGADPAGNSGNTAGAASNSGGGGTGCTGAFCLEDTPDIGVTPDKVVFTDLPPGTEQTMKLAIVNTGNSGVLEITAAKFEGGGDEFHMLDAAGEPLKLTEPVKLATGAHVKWTVVYKPSKAGSKSVHLTLSNNSYVIAKKEFRIPISVKAGAGELKAVPDVLDFGAIASLTTVKKSVRIFNVGDKSQKIEALALSADGSPDFVIDSAPQTPFEVAPSESFEVSVAFTPQSGGVDATSLVVGYPVGQKLVISITGEEIGPLIGVVPAVLNYGQVADGAKLTRSFKIFSKGKADLHIKSIGIDPTSTHKSFFINEAGPLTLKPNEGKIVDVTLTADSPLPKTSAQVAAVLVQSDDPNVATVTVPIKVEGEPCVVGKSDFAVKAAAAKGQVDIIIAIDSSGSMKEEKQAVQLNLNAFAKDIASKNIDHHVVLIGSGMCVPPPLGAPGCKNSAAFQHVNVSVGSTDGLQKIIDTYPQWQGFLRAGAQRHFIMITDDNSKKDANWFKNEQLPKLTNPGFPGGFTFHSIVGWAPQVIPFIGCIGAAGHGTVYIELSQKTGGELASICATQLGVPPDWSQLFQKIGQNVASTVKVTCTYALPAQKDGKAVDPASISLSFKKSDGSDGTVPRVQDSASCPATSHGWYYDNPAAPAAAVLCPESCKQLKGEQLTFNFGC